MQKLMRIPGRKGKNEMIEKDSAIDKKDITACL